MTKPERDLSKGREERCGSSLDVVQREREREKPVRARGWMQDSEPPARMMLASPKEMKRVASPMECAEVVQAVVTAWLGPYLKGGGVVRGGLARRVGGNGSEGGKRGGEVL